MEGEKFQHGLDTGGSKTPRSRVKCPKALACFPLGWRQLFARKMRGCIRQKSSCSMSFLFEKRETLFGDVSTDVVKFGTAYMYVRMCGGVFLYIIDPVKRRVCA